MELRDYLRVLRAHWIGVVAIVVVAVAAAFVYNVTQPKIYAANANGFVSTGLGSDPALASVGDSLAKSRAKSYVDIAQSRATAQDVIDDLGLDTTPAALIGQVSVEQPDDTVLLKITARADTPLEAQQLADAWIKALQTQVRAIEDPKGENGDAGLRIVPVEAAELPSAPVSPKVQRNLALGLVAGLLLGLGYALLRNQLDRRIRSASAVERQFGISVVGGIPTAGVLKHNQGDRAGLAVTSRSSNRGDMSASEAFRKLRTNLQFMHVDNPPRVIVITSPKQGDGKSTVAANLAAVVAASGQPTILVDADLRRPSVATSFGLVEGAGLTDVLIGRADLDDVLQPYDAVPHLSVLAAGGIPPNPSELLGSQAMRKLLHTAADRALVVLDAPPLLPVTDGAVLTAVADGAFIVVSVGRTLDTDLGTCLDYLGAVNGQALGIILNGVPERDAYFRYYRYETPGTEPKTKGRSKGRRSTGGRRKAGPEPAA